MHLQGTSSRTIKTQTNKNRLDKFLRIQDHLSLIQNWHKFTNVLHNFPSQKCTNLNLEKKTELENRPKIVLY